MANGTRVAKETGYKVRHCDCVCSPLILVSNLIGKNDPRSMIYLKS